MGQCQSVPSDRKVDFTDSTASAAQREPNSLDVSPKTSQLLSPPKQQPGGERKQINTDGRASFSQFNSQIELSAKAVSWKHQAGEAADGIIRSLLTISENLPYVGVVAQSINKLIGICDNCRCNKMAFEQLKMRLFYLSKLLFAEDGLVLIASDRAANNILASFTDRIIAVFDESLIYLGQFTKVGYLGLILQGNKPQQVFNDLDVALTKCMNDLSAALQTVQITEQAQTYRVVCDIQARIAATGGLEGMTANPASLQILADEIGADVSDLKSEVLQCLDRIEATVIMVDVNVKAMWADMTDRITEMKAFMEAQARLPASAPADLSALTLRSLPVLDYSKVLGQGGFGTIYEARYNNEAVAVKMITVVGSLTSAQLNELSREVLMHSKVCNLPGVVRLFGANLSSEPRCIVLELADGSLHDALHKRTPSIDLSLTSKLALAVQVCSAMAAISDLGVVHRDIKSSNVLIFLQSQGRVAAKLADFGLTKFTNEYTTTSGSLSPKGTTPYMAPELFSKKYSVESDVYAFTVMLNEILIEEPPFPGCAMADIIHKVVTYRQRPTPYKAAPKDVVGCQLMSLISMGWNQDPQLRTPFGDLSRQLSALLLQAVEVSKHGALAVPANSPSHLPARDVETCITALSMWFASSCSVSESDCLPLAHTLVTVKCITTTSALAQALQRSPDLLTRELRVSNAYEYQIKAALSKLKPRLRLQDLSEEQIGELLDHCKMSSSRGLFREQEISGLIICNSIESWNDLVDLGMKPMPAKTLFKLITEWMLDGLPADFVCRTPSALVKGEHNAWPSSGATTATSGWDGQNATSASISTAGDSFTLQSATAPSADAPSSPHRAMLSDCFTRALCSDIAAAVRIKGAADSGDHLATAYLSCLHFVGCLSIKQDTVQADLFARTSMSWLQTEATSGCKFSLFCFGLYFANGTGVSRSEQEAARYYKLAADQGLAVGQYALGVCYDQGNGVPKSQHEAARYFKLAADQGDASAQNYLAGYYMKGVGVTKSKPEAVRYFQMAADKGHAIAQSNLAWCYDSGRGIDKNRQEAARYYKLAADKGNARAQCAIGVFYDSGTCVPEDKQEAVRYFKLAADQGNVFAQRIMGACYAGGTAVTKNQQEAVRYWKRAADQGDADAQCNLGLCYENSIGLSRNEQEAVKYYKLAADQGHAAAQFALSVCLESGTGVPQNEQDAVKYWKLAAGHGYAAAQYNLGVCYADGTGVSKNQQEAARYYQLAAGQGYARAQHQLAVCYGSGTGVSKSAQEAAKYYQLAAGQGHKQSIEALAALNPPAVKEVVESPVSVDAGAKKKKWSFFF